MSELQTY